MQKNGHSDERTIADRTRGGRAAQPVVIFASVHGHAQAAIVQRDLQGLAPVRETRP